MAVYAIGDLHGCCDPLQRLLEQIRFDPSVDTLWFVGDIVNRGPQSLETLRLVQQLGAAAITVQGNHDLSLLAVAEGFVKLKPKDTIQPILDAPDAAELLAWMRQQPLLHYDVQLDLTLVHAGLAPHWNLAQAQACAAELEAVLRGAAYRNFLAVMYGSQPDCWDDALTGMDRLRCIANYLTRTRFCRVTDGGLDFACKLAPAQAPPGLIPWFEVPWRCNADLHIVFGHWAALGYYRAPGVYALDSGCAWGQYLTALRLDDGGKTVIHIDSTAS